MLKNPQEQPPRWVASPDQSPEMQLHTRCGVYTAQGQVTSVLDAVGWTSSDNLAGARLLEPAAGDGAFLVAAAERLVASFRKHDLPLTAHSLRDRITAFELLESEAALARRKVADCLVRGGVKAATAKSVASRWITTADFLLWDGRKTFTHIVGNPPYCRWSKLPEVLRHRYEASLPCGIARGDIFLPFLDKSIGLLSANAVLGFVCSDRWKFMAFANEFRNTRLRTVIVEADRPLEASSAFIRNVDAYSSLLVLRPLPKGARARPAARKVRTLADAGFRVRVGPALGCTPAFVLSADESNVERTLLAPFVDGRDIGEETISVSGKRVIVMHDREGKLIDLSEYPDAQIRLRSYRKQLSGRAIVRVGGAAWYAPIDRLRRRDWEKPKILVPEIAKIPRFAIDRNGMIPSHGVYAVFAPSPAALSELAEFWSSGGLADELDGKTPKVKGGYTRCYKRFLDASRAPT